MCDFKKISKRKEQLNNSIKKTLKKSDTNVNHISKEVKNLRTKSQENIQRLSLLL